MNKIDQNIISINKEICTNINKFGSDERGILSQNILDKLRTFVERVSLKIYARRQDIDDSYENIQKANNHIKSIGNLKFLSTFYKLLQISKSHYAPSEENSERLMLKYYEYLLKIQSFLKNKYNFLCFRKY